MASEKLEQNQKNTKERLERQEQDRRHKDYLAKLDQVISGQQASIQALAQFLAGKTTKVELTNQLKEVNTPDVEKVVKAVQELASEFKEQKMDWKPLFEQIAPIADTLAAIAGRKDPELPDPVIVDFEETNTRLDNLKASVDALDLVVNVPKAEVKVPQTKLTVEKVDLTVLKKPLLDAVEAIQAIPQPEVVYTDMSGVEKKLDKTNEHLDKLVKQPKGGGGGGGGMVSYKNSAGESVQVETEDNGSIPTSNILAGSNLPIKDDAFYGDGLTNGIASVALRYYNGSSYDRVSSTNPLPVSSSTSVPSTARNGHTSTVTAGTAVALASSTEVEGVIIQGLYSNTGIVYVGDSSVSSSNGFELQPGQATSIAIDNLNKVYIDSAEDGDGVSYIGS